MGWTRAAKPQPCEEDSAELPSENNSGSQKHKSSPRLPVGKRGIFQTGGGGPWEGWCRTRGSCTPSWVFCSAELYIPCKMGNMSLQQTEKTASFVSLLVCVKQLSVEVYVVAAVKKGSSAHQGRRASQMPLLPLGGTAGVMLYGYHKMSVLWISCCSEAGIPGCQGGFWTRPCSITFQQNFRLQKKALCTNIYQVHMH